MVPYQILYPFWLQDVWVIVRYGLNLLWLWNEHIMDWLERATLALHKPIKADGKCDTEAQDADMMIHINDCNFSMQTQLDSNGSLESSDHTSKSNRPVDGTRAPDHSENPNTAHTTEQPQRRHWVVGRNNFQVTVITTDFPNWTVQWTGSYSELSNYLDAWNQGTVNLAHGHTILPRQPPGECYYHSGLASPVPPCI